MTKAEILRYAKAAGLPLDESMKKEELEIAFMSALVAQNVAGRQIQSAPAHPIQREDTADARARQINEARERERKFQEELTAKYEGKVYAAICIPGLPKNYWYRGKTQFFPNRPTLFKVGDTTLNGTPMTGIEIEQILEEPFLLVTEVKSVEVDHHKLLADLLEILPQREVERRLEQLKRQMPRSIKIRSAGLETPKGAPGPRVQNEGETLKFSEEKLGAPYGKEF